MLTTLACRREICCEGWTGLMSWVLLAKSLARLSNTDDWLDELSESDEEDEDSEEDASEDELSDWDTLTSYSLLSLSITATVLFLKGPSFLTSGFFISLTF